MPQPSNVKVTSRLLVKAESITKVHKIHCAHRGAQFPTALLVQALNRENALHKITTGNPTEGEKQNKAQMECNMDIK